VLKAMAAVAQRGQSIMMGQRPILIGYGSEPRPRWGYGRGPHPGLDAVIATGRAKYEGVIREIAAHRAAIEAVPDVGLAESEEACWQNAFMSGLDAAVLFGLVSSRRPKLYLEVGSGYSTKLVARAKREQKLATRIVSIDPMPRAAVDSICDEVVRAPMEDVDLATFDRLEPGDVLFFDGSHYAFMNSDVVTLFLDVLPRLKAGVIVHIHDIFLPYDYPPEWIERYYTEQYLLAMALLAEWRRFDVMFPCQYVAKDAALSAVVRSLVGPRADLSAAASFWLEIRR
jgi:predicted O-methyltransferase YrrM